MASPKQETLWVLRAQSGDREALDELLKTVQGPLYRYILRLAGERWLAEDILQEVFIRVYRKLGWLQDPKLFRPWAYRIASRETFRRLKRERRWADQVRDEQMIEAVAAEPSGEEVSQELLRLLPRMISRVSPASRAVLILHYLDEMPLAQVAEVLGIATGTVKSRLAYGLSSLRRAIEKESGGQATGLRNRQSR